MLSVDGRSPAKAPGGPLASPAAAIMAARAAAVIMAACELDDPCDTLDDDVDEEEEETDAEEDDEEAVVEVGWRNSLTDQILGLVDVGADEGAGALDPGGSADESLSLSLAPIPPTTPPTPLTGTVLRRWELRPSTRLLCSSPLPARLSPSSNSFSDEEGDDPPSPLSLLPRKGDLSLISRLLLSSLAERSSSLSKSWSLKLEHDSSSSSTLMIRSLRSLSLSASQGTVKLFKSVLQEFDIDNITRNALTDVRDTITINNNNKHW